MISLQFGRMLPDCSMFARCIVRPLAPRRCMPLPRYSRAHPKSTFSSSAPKKRAYQTTPEPDATPISAMTVRRQLSELQSEEQRRVLDTVSDIRKCGLDTVLSLPQIVVCGDQSSGKSSVLEALTEIPFPRADNVCTRFATEICLRRDAVSSLTIKVIPDSSRIADEQDTIKAYSETITDFDGLPTVIDNAKRIMGIGEHGSAFARDILSIQIAGPDRPHLSLVDIPGLIHSSTKGVSENDVTVVGKITSHYIEQPRTICLAVISATNDAANQSILEQVRKVDPQGERTLGVITKPDRLDPGSGSETKFLELARNEDVFFTLGWHVVKNRAFKEQDFSMEERKASEDNFFKTSNFRELPDKNLGIDALRVKLSHLLLRHVKSELPRLRADLESALAVAHGKLDALGESRSTTAECREVLAKINMGCYELCKAGMGGHYDQDFFRNNTGDVAICKENLPTVRFRAVIQSSNNEFTENLRKNGHTYQMLWDNEKAMASEVDQRHEDESSGTPDSTQSKAVQTASVEQLAPINLHKKKAIAWAKKALRRCRGTELIGNFNPSLIAELFWEQSEPWEKVARMHIETVHRACDHFLRKLLDARVPFDMRPKLWTAIIQSQLTIRLAAAHKELDELLQDRKDFPINYNHYYTDTIIAKRHERFEKQILGKLPSGSDAAIQRLHLQAVFAKCGKAVAADMESLSCEEALDCVLAIYKVQQKTFVANVVTQVIERHMIRDLQSIFSPLIAFNMTDDKLESLVSEPSDTRRQRALLKDRIKKLKDGEGIFRSVMGF